jgi:ketosteroid isomerase-like protein
MLNRLIPFAGAALLASTAPAHTQTGLAAARESLRATDAGVSSHVQRAGLMGGLAPHLADSADLLIPGAVPLHGRDAALAGLAASPFAASRLAWTPIRLEVSADGRSGYTFGGGTMSGADGTSTHARFVAFWRRAEGEWELAAFMFSPSPEPVTPPPAGFFPADAAPLPAARVDAAAALQAIMQADRDFAALAMARSPGAAFEAWAAPDGTLLGGAYGPRATGALFAPGGTLEWGPVAGGAAGSGDLGYTVGTAVRRGADGRVGYTKYITIWRRQPDGEWKWVVDGGNPRPADASGR